MANNRMWLIHKPSRLGIMLGKRFGSEWKYPPDQDRLQEFYDYLYGEVEGSQDDFILAMEDCFNSSCFDNWKYTGKMEGGFHKFEFLE